MRRRQIFAQRAAERDCALLKSQEPADPVVIVQEPNGEDTVAIDPGGCAPVVIGVKKKGRGMCPKCKVKPNYFMHVKNCRGTNA